MGGLGGGSLVEGEEFVADTYSPNMFLELE
jgi:hypothetical protein